MKLPPAPADLSPEAQALWRATTRVYELRPDELTLLRLALEALDRANQARQRLAEEGILLEGRYGPRVHPAIAIERSATLTFARLMRQLGLDDAAAVHRAPGRPQVL